MRSNLALHQTAAGASGRRSTWRRTSEAASLSWIERGIVSWPTIPTAVAFGATGERGWDLANSLHHSGQTCASTDDSSWGTPRRTPWWCSHPTEARSPSSASRHASRLLGRLRAEVMSASRIARATRWQDDSAVRSAGAHCARRTHPLRGGDCANAASVRCTRDCPRRPHLGDTIHDTW